MPRMACYWLPSTPELVYRIRYVRNKMERAHLANRDDRVTRLGKIKASPHPGKVDQWKGLLLPTLVNNLRILN